MAGARDVYRVEALASPAGELHLFKVAEIESSIGVTQAYVARWPGDIRLLDVDIEMEAGTPVLRLEWAIDGAVDAGQTVFVHVRNTADEIVYQDDGDLIGGIAPFSSWPSGAIVHERQPLILPSEVPAGTYVVV